MALQSLASAEGAQICATTASALEACGLNATRSDRLSEEERKHMLKVFDRMIARIPSRSQAEADAEIAEIRAARRTGGRRTRLEMIHLDTSVLIDAFSGEKPLAPIPFT